MAVRRLRISEGSHDKLAARLGTSRQRVIGWENGAMPSGTYREKLIALGVPEALFHRPGEKQEIEKRLSALEGEVARIRQLVQDWP